MRLIRKQMAELAPLRRSAGRLEADELRAVDAALSLILGLRRSVELGHCSHTHSQTDSVSALDGANTGTEPDPHDRRDKTAHAAAVAQR
jgi:hypothetical protein